VILIFDILKTIYISYKMWMLDIVEAHAYGGICPCSQLQGVRRIMSLRPTHARIIKIVSQK
jgi:hypothetical protein